MAKDMTTQNTMASNINRRIILELLLRLPVTVTLLLIGLAIILGPKWYPEIIHIRIAHGHGFTTQDAVALIPISLGLVWFSIGLWKYRLPLRNYICTSPEIAFILALLIGLLSGIYLGTGIGTIFESDIISIAKSILQ